MTRRPIFGDDTARMYPHWRRVLHWHGRNSRQVQRRAAKHERRQAQQEIRRQLADEGGAPCR